ncbi:UNVERIFIED_CONTAM: hypothetical protein HDU68_012503 [Siphonaria sp. JEL0065]|nr:hypothetical protein HDU68_012503 [Siphonaria sp. JEL0065]
MTQQLEPPPWQLWKDLVSIAEAPQYATTLLLLHGIYVAFLFRLSHSYQPNRILRSLFCCLLIGLGGGSLAAILTGKPVGWLLNNDDLFLYSSGFFIVCGNPFVFPIMKALRPLAEGSLDLVDVILRAQVLTRFQTQLRTHSPSNTTIPQIILGIISITGGGLIYNWSFSPDLRFKYPGHDFTTVILVNIFYAWTVSPVNRKVIYTTLWNTLPMQRVRAMGYDGYLLKGYSLAQDLLVEWCKVLGVPTTFKGKAGERDLRILCALLLLIGFFLRPGRWTRWLDDLRGASSSLASAEEEQPSVDVEEDDENEVEEDVQQNNISGKNHKKPQKRQSKEEFIVE